MPIRRVRAHSILPPCAARIAWPASFCAAARSSTRTGRRWIVWRRRALPSRRSRLRACFRSKAPPSFVGMQRRAVWPSARSMLPRLIHTHLHDNHGIRDEHLVPGEGIVDWPALLGVLRRGGYTGARLLELAPRDGFRRERWEDELALGHRVLSSE